MTTDANYLTHLPDWSIDHAQKLAVQEDIVLSPEHIQILQVAREFYDSYGFSPSMRPLCKTITGRLGIQLGRSIYLNQQFPGSPAKLIAKLAGLPTPKNCL
jgi:tRNA 2-thiouridine synthesizing protein E